MCCGGSNGSLSRLGLSAGVLSTLTLATALLSSTWMYTREPLALPGKASTYSNVTFRIGLWRVCPTLKRVIASHNTLLPSPGCQLIRYSGWPEVKEADLGISWTSLEFTPSLVSKIRYAMPLIALAVAFLTLATLFALLGHCHSDLKTLVACGLYTIGGLILASGLVVFVSVLSDVYTDHRPHSQLEYRYGWSFHAAGAAFVLSEVAALVSITAYLRRFSTVEEMVRAMVPGADRKLKRRQFDCRADRRESEMEPSLPTPPDVCTSNPPNSLGTDTVPSIRGSLGALEQVNRYNEESNLKLTLGTHKALSSHPATLVLPQHDPYRYTTIIHQGILGVAEGTSSSGSSVSCSSHSLPRRLPHSLDLRRSLSPSSGSQGYCSSIT